jgi:hypothetical protein
MALTTTAHDDEDRSSRPRDLMFGLRHRCPRGRNIEYKSRNDAECLELTFDCGDRDRFSVEQCGCGCKPQDVQPQDVPQLGAFQWNGPRPQRCNTMGPPCPDNLECLDPRGVCDPSERACPGVCGSPPVPVPVPVSIVAPARVPPPP